MSGLCKVWDYDPAYEQALKTMGYGALSLLLLLVCRSPLDFSLREFDLKNGCGGRMPVTMKEWIKVGIWRTTPIESSASSDQKAYCLMKFLYSLNNANLHDECMGIVAPGTLRHVGEKTCHLAATNMTDGTSKNTN